jgi:hypothetical protein
MSSNLLKKNVYSGSEPYSFFFPSILFYRIALKKCLIRLDLLPLMVYKQKREFGLTNRIPFKLFGADVRSRTADLLITNQLLYQLSYVGFIYSLNK